MHRNWKILKLGVYPKRGQIMSYVIEINFCCNDFLLSLNDVRNLNSCLLSPTRYQAYSAGYWGTTGK